MEQKLDMRLDNECGQRVSSVVSNLCKVYSLEYNGFKRQVRERDGLDLTKLEKCSG